MQIDTLIEAFDKGLRTLWAPAQTVRPVPGQGFDDVVLGTEERRESIAMMRINHCGEVCAQGLYQGQALTAKTQRIKASMAQSALEEGEHLAWTEARLKELGGEKSILNPFFFVGSLTVGALSGLLGDRWSLGFVVETERQVAKHLQSHLNRLPPQDQKSRAIVSQMCEDELTHAKRALEGGGIALPKPVKMGMSLSAKLMTSTTYWL
jgi:ubiquinone biosynthesis monooxygenase Coq7